MTEENRQIPVTGLEGTELGTFTGPELFAPEAPDRAEAGAAGSDLLLDETNDRLMIAEAGSFLSRDQMIEQESGLEIDEISTAAAAWAAEICRADTQDGSPAPEQALSDDAAVEAVATEDPATALQTADWLNW